MSIKNIMQIRPFNIIGIIFICFLYSPLIFLVVFSFNQSRSVTVWESFSWEWYVKAFNNENILTALKNSLIVASCSAFVGTTLSLFAAIAFVRGKNFKGKLGFYTFLNMPIMIPEIVAAVSTLSFFSFIGLKLGLINLIFAYTVFCIPFSFMPIYSRLKGLNYQLEEASYDLYANYYKTLFKVTIPILKPAILSGFMMAFVMSMDDFIIALMIADAGSTTLPVYIYGMVKIGLSPEVNAISTIVLFFSFIIVFLSFTLQKR